MPWMCEEPFSCNRPPDFWESTRTGKTMATKDGHANPRAWCSALSYADNLVKDCIVDKDLEKSAHNLYKVTTAGKFGPFTAEMDGSYCFIEGHCSNTAVTKNTTLEEAEQMCDERYGHDGWAVNFGMEDMVKLAPFVLKGGMTLTDGFKNMHITKFFLKAACAMGNYHCGVLYCRETYCKDPYYIKKYGYLLPKIPGHLIEQKDRV